MCRFYLLEGFIMSNYGKKISELRKQHNLTQADLGTKLNISAQAVSKWENGLSEPDIASLKKLCDIFNISLDDLLEIDSSHAKQEEQAEMLTEQTSEEKKETQEPEKETKIINGYCEKCKTPVGPGEYQVSHLYYEKGKVSKDERQHIFCNDCHKKMVETKKEQEKKEEQIKRQNLKKEKQTDLRKGLLFGILFACIGALLGVLYNNAEPEKASFLYIVFFAIGGYTFSALCFWDCYVADLFGFFCRSFKFPFIFIFELSIDGLLMWIIVKLSLWIIGAALSITFFCLGLVICMALSIVSFPFILISQTKEIKSL